MRSTRSSPATPRSASSRSIRTARAPCATTAAASRRASRRTTITIPKRSAAEIVFTELHAGGKFDQNSYKVSGGLHGVGVSVVNALSTWLRCRIWREGKEHFIEFRDGVAVAPLKVVGDAEGRARHGGHVLAEHRTRSTKVEFDFATLEHRLRELAFLNSGAKVVLDGRAPRRHEARRVPLRRRHARRSCAISTARSRPSSPSRS